MKAKVGLENTSTVYSKLSSVYNQYKPIDIIEKLNNIEDDVTVISPTVPYDVCKVLRDYYDCNITVLYSHPVMERIKEYFKDIELIKINIFDTRINNYIKGSVILHDFQYMAPLNILPYNLKTKPIIFHNNTRMECDEQINQNFYRR